MSINGEPIDGREAVQLGLADEFSPSATAVLRAFQTAQAFGSGKKKRPTRDWDSIAARQKKKLQALLARPEVKDMLSLNPPPKDQAGDLRRPGPMPPSLS